MSISKNPGPEQDRLLVVAEQTGQIQPRDFNETDGPAIPLVEHYLHLQNVLTCIAGINMRRGFLSNEGFAEQFYGEAADAVREGAQRNLEYLVKTAKTEFSHAVGHFARIDAGKPKEEVRAQTRTRFSDFLKRYGGVRHRDAAYEYREFLARKVGILQGTIQPSAEDEAQPIPIVPERELPKLPLLDRLEAIQKDPRAGFLPSTRQEANQVFAWLDESDVGEQVLEAQNHTQKYKGAGWREGVRTVESILYVVSDYLLNAVNSHESLAELQLQLTEYLNPKVLLAEEIGEEHPAYAVLARFKDISEYAATGTVAGLKRLPMRTREDRWTREGDGPHKKIEDQYTAKEPKPAFEKRIAQLPASLTIREARELIAEALENEEKRADFMLEQIDIIRKSLASKRLFANIVEIAEATITQQRRVS